VLMKSLLRMKLLVSLGKKDTGPPVQPLKRKSIQPEQETTHTVLAVDDEPSSLEFVESVLGGAGIMVHTSSSVREAIKYLQTNLAINLILCDLQMPGQSGFDLLEFLRSNLRFRHTSVVILSAFSNAETVGLALSLGARDYLRKPIDTSTLLSRVKAILDFGRGTVMVVSDNELTLSVLRLTLERAGYKVHTARQGEQGIEMFERAEPTIVISELVLEDMTGLEFMLKIKEFEALVPMLFISDPLVNVFEEDMISAGAHGMIQKPFNNFEILRKVDGLRADLRSLIRTRR